MNNELELLEFLRGYSNENNLTLSFDELLKLFNDQKAPINNYLYSKIFFNKEKGIKFINKLGLYFPEQTEQRYNSNKSNDDNSVTKEDVATLVESDDDFFDDITESDEFKKIKDIDLVTKVDTYKFNDLYFERLQENEKDIELITQIVNANQQLVMKIASRYQKTVLGSILDFDDLISSGNLGLLKAIKKFDISLGYQFSTYAIWWIKQKITRDIADRKHTIRLPVHMVESLNKLNSLLKKYGDYSTEEIERICTSEMNITKEKFYELLYIDKIFNKNLTSLQSSIGEDNDTSLGEMLNYDQNLYQNESITPENIITRKIFREEMENYFKTMLTEKQEDILKQRIGWNAPPKTLEEIGVGYGVTRERIRQIEAKSIDKLRRKLEKDGIRRYLEEL
ncbi:sigma-70 family RNA polymerase sigma factor [Staphylococcus caprae]|uniref:sigma-70 family RNA polymerase sigma factor n=1 Tax=Staphylococcus caprae TaxID=29380 RepID=UPI001F591C64|nr:sigma-70 family RNA polymerase sigma factor [Staphylococcus caprae]MCI2955659.1 sigma-70 family RNA polymerase sigma factor [Staphylococcus caprae]